ncbi:MAG: hydroxymethylbilane synthase, partial [Chloroflexi bacterium]
VWPLPVEIMLPAVGQGALALEVRADDAETQALVAPLNHAPTWAAVTAERAFLRTLGGGCQVPVAAYGRLEAGELLLDGLVATPDGQKRLRGQVRGHPDEAESLGQRLAERLLNLGARCLLEPLATVREEGGL